MWWSLNHAIWTPPLTALSCYLYVWILFCRGKRSFVDRIETIVVHAIDIPISVFCLPRHLHAHTEVRWGYLGEIGAIALLILVSFFRCFVSGVVSALNEWTAQRVTEWTALEKGAFTSSQNGWLEDGHTKSSPRDLPLIEGFGERASMLALLVV